MYPPDPPKHFDTLPMVSNTERLQYQLHIMRVPDLSAMIGWAEMDEEQDRSYGDKPAKLTKHLCEIDSRIFLQTPQLVASNIRLDLRFIWDNPDKEPMIAELAQIALFMQQLELRNPLARPRDRYVSGRHYSSIDLHLDESSNQLAKKLFYRQSGTQICGDLVSAVERRVIYSRHGNHSFSGSGLAQFLGAVAQAKPQDNPDVMHAFTKAMEGSGKNS